MNIKIRLHIMPWELDSALLTYNQLSKSIYYCSNDDKITFESCLNISDYVINWEESKLSKEFFINKYENLKFLLSDKFDYISKIYDGNELYGHLDFERESISPEIDAYISICPDVMFDKYLISYMIEGAKQIKNKYFIITPQIPKLWDSTWDVLVNPIYKDISYGTKHNFSDIMKDQIHSNQETTLKPINEFKYAGWFDLYSKKYYEDLAPIWDEWHGKGGWDTYSMNVSSCYKYNQGDVQQYVLEGQIMYRLSYCKDFNLNSYYKNNIKLNTQSNTRDSFDEKIPFYIREQLNKLFKINS